MAKKKQRIPHKYFPWIDARKKFRLSDAHIQMARELGLSPKNFPKYANTKDQPWKLPLPEFIESLYVKQFKREFPEQVMTLEQMAAEHVARREARKAAKASEESTSGVASEEDSVEESDATVTDAESLAPEES